MNGKLKLFNKKIRIKREYEGFLYILPWLIGTILFFCYPVYKTVMISLGRITTYTGLVTEWIGLENYRRIFTRDVTFLPNFITVIKDTFINVPLILVFALFIAIIVDKDIKGKGFFRGIFILPFLLGSGYIFKTVVGIEVEEGVTTVSQGIIIPAPVLAYMGARFTQVIRMFLDRISLILLKSPIQIIVFMGALQSIPISLYESAKCDGATEWEMFWKITLPMLVNQILFNTIFTLVESFTDLSNPVIDSIMGAWFTDKNYEYTAAMGWVYLLFIILVSTIIFAIWGHTNKTKKQQY
jgi:ABC-type sugar transport system permease subunit